MLSRRQAVQSLAATAAMGLAPSRAWSHPGQPVGSAANRAQIVDFDFDARPYLTQLKNAASVDGDVYVSIVPFNKDVNIGSSNYAASYIDWTDYDASNAGTGGGGPSGSICFGLGRDDGRAADGGCLHGCGFV